MPLFHRMTAYAAFLAPLLLPLAARAQSLPVVNVNNEIGLAADVMLQDQEDHYLPGNGPSPELSGWQPGLDAKASVMKDLWGISNVYAALRFAFNNGESSISPSPPYAGTYNRQTENLDVELGKGFLITDRLLLTPFIQGGYTNFQSSDFNATDTTTNGFVGLGLRGDYALTERLVVTGRLGWAETVGGNLNTPANYNFGYGDGPMWQAGIGLDYLVYSHIHLYGGVDYTDYTLARGALQSAGFPDSRAPQANFNDLNFHLGIAWGF